MCNPKPDAGLKFFLARRGLNRDPASPARADGPVGSSRRSDVPRQQAHDDADPFSQGKAARSVTATEEGLYCRVAALA